ncbi:DUF397 domain-containing protein [Actinomadura rayongensis]|uniref:DUF397 domain-containing protein n=1 Tax=Actinomadura rayongensis TaxID=1429076 RepID=A0A6I4W873_9ACTN|nr:DUF397 domain-containing protein [Actinomadura rayongensis]MXQ64455.1 DUF397 domain-containing protein [Actinomadura rayongensis]
MIQWRKSSRSEGSRNGACVELAGLSGFVGVRDSKDPDAGHLTLAPETFAALLARVKNARA